MDSCINKKAIWLTWERQVRNRSLADLLNIPLYEIDIGGSRIHRYFQSIKLTLRIIKKHQPDIVFHQNPSMVLAVVMAFLKLFFKYKLIVDCHNAAVFPFEGRSRFFNGLAKLVGKHADLLVVHNKAVAKKVDTWQANTEVLADPLPIPKQAALDDVNSNKDLYILYICSWSDDEPYTQVIETGRMLEKSKSSCKIYITGKIPDQIRLLKLPSNIILTGFLAYEKYLSLLVNSAMVMALTERNNSLNCGGYEALAYEKPCILSDTKVLRNVFNKPFVFTENNAQSIFTAIEQSIALKNELQLEMKQRKSQYLAEYRCVFDKFVESVNRL